MLMPSGSVNWVFTGGLLLGVMLVGSVLMAAVWSDLCPSFPPLSVTLTFPQTPLPTASTPSLTLTSHIPPRAPPHPATYTPPPFHSTRWPPPTPPTGLRGVVLSLYTGYSYGQDDWLRRFWPDNERHFFAPFADHVHWVLFYLRWPGLARDALRQSMTQPEPNAWNWRLLPDAERVIIPPHTDWPLTSKGEEYLTPLGAHVLLMPLIVNMPVHLAADPGKLDLEGWTVCGGHPWDMDYIMYSGAAYVHQMLSHPVLRSYDYYVKMDLDNHWHTTPPESPHALMARRGCMWMHSNKGGPEDCGIDAYDAAHTWATERNVIPQSEGQIFMHVEQYGNFAGNFLGGWLGWLTSEENLDFAKFLYEDARYPGYFQRRWGDQPPYVVMLGMFHNLTVDEFVGHAGTTVCDLEEWRGPYFRHKS